jgi:hypothetical protein
MNIKEILKQHSLWLADNSQGKRAVLHRANLRRADLSGANLCNMTIAKDFISDGGYHHVSNVGSENGILELYSCGDKGWYIKRGCFSGSLDEFIAKVKETHGDNEHAQQYLGLVDLLCKGNK